MTNQGYMPKELRFGADGRGKLIDGITKISSAVKSTLGPAGNTVLIESLTHTHGITVTKDGVTVAKSIDLADPVENLAVKIIREASDRTATSSGDGTTSTVVLAEALIKAGTTLITNDVNRTDVLRSLVEQSEQVVDKLRKSAKKVAGGVLQDVATVSANNDKFLGKLIADAYKSVGKDGLVTVERSSTEQTYSESTQGLKFSRGYYSGLFVNNQKRDECILENPVVLVCDAEISSVRQLENMLKPVVSGGKSLLIIAPCTQAVVNTFAANVIKNGMKVCLVQPPSFGYKQHELMSDIAMALGAKYFSEKTGDDLSLITYADLGAASKIVVSKDTTIIIRSDRNAMGEVINNDAISKRIDELRVAHKEAAKKSDKNFIAERIASLAGGIGVIYVGGNTDLEQKELFDRIDDAVCAVRSAIEEGIVPGAGVALLNCREVRVDLKSKAEMVANDILYEALGAPFYQILANAGLDMVDVYPREFSNGEGYNLKTGEFGDLIKMGVVDPVKVVRSSLQNAVSVAVTILSTNAIITLARTQEAVGA